MKVLTLVNTNGFPSTLEAEVVSFLKTQEVCIHREKSTDFSIEITFDGTITLQELQTRAACWQVDYAVQSVEHRDKKLLVSDMESTLVQNEFLDDIAALAGIGEQVKTITERAMRGELDFEASLRERVKLLTGFSVEFFEEAWKGLRWMPGAEELIQTLNEHHIPTVIVSGGFRFFTQRVCKRLGAECEHANDVEIKEGILTGNPKGKILTPQTKQQILLSCAAAKGLATTETVAIGDGANDIPMLQTAGLGIAFHAKPLVIASAPYHIRYSDLRAVLYFLGIGA